jgi:pimeloyl-ACP methyl ester carboxylesterase
LARQKYVATPLHQFGIGSVLIESPYYGTRKPSRQFGTYLDTVSDLWCMGLAVVSEARAVLEWLRAQGFQTLAVCGVSMGGAMASQTAALTPFPVAMCACIAPHCASPVFLNGVLSRYVDWPALGEKGRESLKRQLDGSDLRLFPTPPRPDCALFLPAKHDAYVEPDSSLLAARCWPGAKMRWLNNGHVGTTMFHRFQYVKGIVETLELLKGSGVQPEIWLP